MGEQLDMFGAPPSAKAAPSCPEHGPGNVCTACPERYATDHSGFVHREDCKGRIPLRKCHRCKRLTTFARWNHADWYHCLECQPQGTRSEMGAARSPDTYLKKKK